MKKEDARRGIAASLDMPLELERGIAKITIVGGSVLVENYGEIRKFSEERVVLRCGKKDLVIRGKGLSLGLLKKDEIEAEGEILGVYFEEGSE